MYHLKQFDIIVIVATAIGRLRLWICCIEIESAEAVPLESPLQLASPAAIAARLFPVLDLDADAATALAQGKRPAVPDAEDAPVAAALAPGGALIGLARVQGGRAHVLMNLPQAAS